MSVRPSGALRSLVVRPATHDSTLVHVRLRDEATVPDVDELHGWIDAIAADHPAITTIRSAALFPGPRPASRRPGSRSPIASCCYAPISTTSAFGQRWAGRGDRATGTMRRHHFDAAAAIDRAAFGEAWGHDAE